MTETTATEKQKKGKTIACKLNGESILLILTIISVILGVAVGVDLKFGIKKEPQLTPRQIKYLAFPGEIFLRMLKLLILPLITSSLISSLTSLDSKTAGKLGLYATLYYFSTTFLAVLTGIILVLAIKPGYYGDKVEAEVIGEASASCKGTTPADTLLDLFRKMFPPNIVQATFESSGTCMRWIKHEGNTTSVIRDFNEYMNLSSSEKALWFDDPYEVYLGGMNILGIIVFAIVFGMVINRMGPAGRPLADFFCSMEGAMMKMVGLVIWLSPIGIFFLIAAQIVNMGDLVKELQRLGMYMVTVLVGLVIHGCITLPVLFTIISRRNPFKFIYGMLQALLTALGIASSSATMPLTFKCLEENNKVDSRVTRFMIPLGATINMDGTALYEAVAALYIAQTIRRSLNIGEVILISLSATLASIGAAGIPQAGLVTMVMVLIAVGLPPRMYTLIVPVDWLLDRIRTMINVHGDSMGTAIVERLCRSQLAHNEHTLSRDGSVKGDTIYGQQKIYPETLSSKL